MYYIINDKILHRHLIIEAVCNKNRVWTNAFGQDRHYEYYGINEDDGWVFDTRQIVKKSNASSKEKIKLLYPEYFL